MSDNTFIFLAIFVPVILFVGEPDLMDSIIYKLNNEEQTICRVDFAQDERLEALK